MSDGVSTLRIRHQLAGPTKEISVTFDVDLTTLLDDLDTMAKAELASSRKCRTGW